MATLIPTLTLTSTDATSDTLNFSVIDTLTTTAPNVNLSQIIVDTTGANNIIVAANDNKQSWVYIKHTGTTDGSTATTAHCDVEITGDVAVGTLKPGEFCWFPFCGNGASKGVQLQAVGSSVQMEYAYWSDSTGQ
tara:strand:- start:724 stop:1128 length:405 start_codon:yes stop_codon:yes gene_type:complete